MSAIRFQTATHAYIAREKCCGAVSAATVEGYEGVAEDVAAWINDGRSVERVTRAEARRLMSETKYPCDCAAASSLVTPPANPDIATPPGNTDNHEGKT